MSARLSLMLMSLAAALFAAIASASAPGTLKHTGATLLWVWLAISLAHTVFAVVGVARSTRNRLRSVYSTDNQIDGC